MDRDWLKAALGDPINPVGEDWATISRRLGRDPARSLGQLIPRGIVDLLDPYGVNPDAAAIASLTTGAAAIQKLAGDQSATLSPDEEAGILLLARIAGRPAIPVSRGQFAAPPKQWSFLGQSTSVIESRMRSVGRIDAPAGVEVGTGFLVHDTVVMTNRHVLTDLLDAAKKLRTDVVIDFARELDGRSAPFALSEVLYVSDDPKVDLALLRVTSAPGLPPPLAIVPTVSSTADHLVYAIGYPMVDKAGASDTVLRSVFRDALGVKRLQPGLMKRLDADTRRFLHDCSTLGGSSGSCVVDFETGLVCGLHFGMTNSGYNAAVALWSVSGHPKISPYVRLG